MPFYEYVVQFYDDWRGKAIRNRFPYEKDAAFNGLVMLTRGGTSGLVVFADEVSARSTERDPVYGDFPGTFAYEIDPLNYGGLDYALAQVGAANLRAAYQPKPPVLDGPVAPGPEPIPEALLTPPEPYTPSVDNLFAPVPSPIAVDTVPEFNAAPVSIDVTEPIEFPAPPGEIKIGDVSPPRDSMGDHYKFEYPEDTTQPAKAPAEPAKPQDVVSTSLFGLAVIGFLVGLIFFWKH